MQAVKNRHDAVPEAGVRHMVFLLRNLRARVLLLKLQRLDPSIISNRMKKDYTRSRKRLIRKLINMGPEILRTLLKFSRLEGYYYRKVVYEVIGQICEDPVDVFIEGLQDPDREIRWSCVKWLRDKGNGFVKAILPLAKYIRRYPFEETDAAVAMAGIDPGLAAQALIALICDKKASQKARLNACLGLDYQVEKDLDTEPLVDILQDPEEDIVLREAIPAVLGALEKPSFKVLPQLIEALESGEEKARKLAIEAIGLIGHGTDAVMMSLLRTREEDSTEMRKAADYALTKLHDVKL